MSICYGGSGDISRPTDDEVIGQCDLIVERVVIGPCNLVTERAPIPLLYPCYRITYTYVLAIK